MEWTSYERGEQVLEGEVTLYAPVIGELHVAKFVVS